MSIYELRNVARMLQIKKPIDLSRDDLIDAILQNGKSNVVGVTEVLLKDVPDPTPISVETGVKSPERKFTGEMRGFVYIVPRGSGILIESFLSTCYISVKIIISNGLKTGDFIYARVCDGNVVEIDTILPSTFADAKSVRPEQVINIDSTPIKLGQRIILKSRGGVDCVEYITRISKQTTEYKIALLVDESDDCVDFLKDNGINECFLAKVSMSIKQRLLCVLLSLLNAKQNAEKGKDVILIIDNMNKLYKLYNSTVHQDNQISTNSIFLGPLIDLKTLFMEPKQIKDGGSLTIMSFMRDSQSEVEKFIMDDFINISSGVVMIE